LRDIPHRVVAIDFGWGIFIHAAIVGSGAPNFRGMQ
jgi:hypothetical protein